MKVLLDSGVWWKWALNLPLKKPLNDFFEGGRHRMVTFAIIGRGNALQNRA